MNKQTLLNACEKREEALDDLDHTGHMWWGVHVPEFIEEVYKEEEERLKDRENRKTAFGMKLEPFLETYDRKMLAEFFDYWTEHGDNDRKMRFEKEKSFNVSLRLSRWAKNSWNKTIGGEEPTSINLEKRNQ